MKFGIQLYVNVVVNLTLIHNFFNKKTFGIWQKKEKIRMNLMEET